MPSENRLKGTNTIKTQSKELYMTTAVGKKMTGAPEEATETMPDKTAEEWTEAMKENSDPEDFQHIERDMWAVKAVVDRHPLHLEMFVGKSRQDIKELVESITGKDLDQKEVNKALKEYTINAALRWEQDEDRRGHPYVLKEIRGTWPMR